ncbi:uncharacterized protein LOC129896621 [Solanum dulcamara]|uniref:uncharacterized protein LOC129896621 n=1 Tax=Solanum dulcamara TaxID=45834 RepID=UPI002486AE96|nr:uncharacterized protein LOC129896621 [Solanum dulcamara]
MEMKDMPALIERVFEEEKAPKKEENDSSAAYGNSSSTLKAEEEKLDPVITEEEAEMFISWEAVVEYTRPYNDPRCVTGYHEKRPLKILISVGGTSHNFIDESLADKLGCDSYPIEPRTVNTSFGKMVTSRACNNFKFSVQDSVFNVKLYLLPLSSNCEIVLGNQWMRSLENFSFEYRCMGFNFQIGSEKHFVSFNNSVDDEGSKR